MSECTHHWVIEPATGPVSLGKYQLCYEVRKFQNSIPDTKDGSLNLTSKERIDDTTN